MAILDFYLYRIKLIYPAQSAFIRDDSLINLLR